MTHDLILKNIAKHIALDNEETTSFQSPSTLVSPHQQHRHGRFPLAFGNSPISVVGEVV